MGKSYGWKPGHVISRGLGLGSMGELHPDSEDALWFKSKLSQSARNSNSIGQRANRSTSLRKVKVTLSKLKFMGDE